MLSSATCNFCWTHCSVLQQLRTSSIGALFVPSAVCRCVLPSFVDQHEAFTALQRTLSRGSRVNAYMQVVLPRGGAASILHTQQAALNFGLRLWSATR